MQTKEQKQLWKSTHLLINNESKTYLLITYNYLHVKNIVSSFFHSGRIPDDQHFFHTLEFFRDIRDLGYQMLPSDNLNIMQNIKNIDLSIFFDYTLSTSYQVNYLRERNAKVKIILSLAENPYYLNKLPESFYSNFDNIYSAHSIDCKFSKTDTAFIYKHIPFLSSKSTENYLKLNSTNFDSSIINSNLHSFSSDCNYNIRKNLIEISSNVNSFDFRWYGRGWFLNNVEKLKRKNWRYLKSDLCSSTRLSNDAKSKYYGTVRNKSILANCKSTFAIENISTPENYYTEKLFEPLEYGCLPIFLKTKNINNNIFDAIQGSDYSNLIKDSPFKLLVTALEVSRMDLNQTQNIAYGMRKLINNYLQINDFNTNLYNCYKEILSVS